MKRVSESAHRGAQTRSPRGRRLAMGAVSGNRGRRAKDPVGIVSFDEIRREYEAALEEY